MWRLVLITFGFLGFAFYELSGGSDYVPGQNSLQVQAARQDTVTVVELAPAQTPSIAEIAKSVESAQPAPRLNITLASISTDDSATSTGPKIERLTASDPTLDDAADQEAVAAAEEEVREVWPGAIELFAIQAEQRVARNKAIAEAQANQLADSDIRYVTGNVVNMRGGPGTEFTTVGKLSQGTEVAVLDTPGNGWLKLRVMDTGEEGWMADWLVSASVN